MINFTDKHFFGPKGEVHLIHDKMDLHTDYVFQNPKLFGFKSIEHADSLSNDQFWNKVMDNGFIRGEYFQTQGNARKPIHNHNLTYEASKGAIPSKFVKALETLHRHYSQKPNTEFKIGVFAGSNMKEDASLSNILSKITGGGYELSTLDHIKQMIDLGKGNKENQPVIPVKKISRREIEQKTNTGLGKEIRMGRGDMTTAEWNFWRRKGLGDSYMPLNSRNVQLIKEHLYTKLHEAMDPPFAQDEEGGIEPEQVPIKPFVWPDGTYHWAPFPTYGGQFAAPQLWAQPPTGDPNDTATTNWVLQWLDKMPVDQIINNPKLMEWLISVWVNNGNLDIMQNNGEDIIEDIRFNLDYKDLIMNKLAERLIRMNSLYLNKRMNLAILYGILSQLPESYNLSYMVGLGIFSWRFLQNILPDGWYPSDPNDQIEFINDPLIEHNPYWPQKFPNWLPWQEFQQLEPDIINPEGLEPPNWG